METRLRSIETDYEMMKQTLSVAMANIAPVKTTTTSSVRVAEEDLGGGVGVRELEPQAWLKV